MRKFYLEHDGTRISLNNESGILFHSPAGLGVTFSNSYAEIGNGFFKRTKTAQKQGSVTGTLTFMAAAYTNYETFVNTILTADKLVLVYDPCGTEYKADVSMNFLTKSESVIGKQMSVPVSFSLESLWYTEQTLTGTGSVSVTAGGQIGSAIALTSTGTALTNPVITLGSFATIDITDTLAATDTLKYSNYYDDSYVVSLISGVETDELVNVDTSNAIYEHSNAAYTVTLTDDNSASPAITVVVRKYWRTV